MNRERTALVVGATGLVGGQLLDRLLTDARWNRVRVLTRRSVGVRHPKLDERVVDFDRLEEYGEAFRVQDVFCCLGTTRKKAGSRSAFKRVDHDYVLHVAQLSGVGRVRHFLFVSAIGAHPDSLDFYSRTKGLVEEAMPTLPLERWTAVRPSLLLGDRDESRLGERVAGALMRPVRPLLVGPLRKYRPIHADQVAAGMIALANDEPAPAELEYVQGRTPSDPRKRRSPNL